jgi:hypothetical protein
MDTQKLRITAISKPATAGLPVSPALTRANNLTEECMKSLKVGSIVKMNEAFLKSLDANDRRKEKRRRYFVEAIQKCNEGTVFVDLAYGRNNTKKTNTTAGWLTVVE